MTLLGWLAGSTISHFIHGLDHWIALALLAFVSANMIRSGMSGDCESYHCDPSKGRTLIMLSVATSLDAMAVGLSFAMIGSAVLLPSLVIGVVAFSLSVIGLQTGCRLGMLFGKRMEILGGLLLIAIGLRIVFTHLFPVI